MLQHNQKMYKILPQKWNNNGNNKTKWIECHSEHKYLTSQE